MARELSQAGLDLIKQFEGLRLTAYRDAVGVLTIGYGWTQPVDGKPIQAGMTITREQAEALLKEGVKPYCAVVNNVCPTATDDQFAAMVSLAYNIGSGAFAKSSVARHHAAGNPKQAANAFLLWNKAGGKVLPGLVRRREAERALYVRGLPA